MIKERINIAENGAVLETYALSSYEDVAPERKRPMVIICPGGGYSVVASREAECVALRLNASGISAAVLYYSVAPAKYPQALKELAQSVAHVRKNAQRYMIRADEIAVMGFSAGGHLAASLATMWNDGALDKSTHTSAAERKPDALILCYPVITGGEYAHRGSFDNLLGKGASESLLSSVSLENRVTGDMVPTFIWHTWDDVTVPIENSLLFASALRRQGISCELHIYRRGEHGLGLATADFVCPKHPKENKRVARWIDEAVTWIEETFTQREANK